MKQITVPAPEELSPETQQLFEQMKKRLGRVPNLYATMGYSSHALKAFMDIEADLIGGAFNGKQREAIALMVSEVNHCEYCLAGHTVAAIKQRLTMEDTLDIRRGQSSDEKIKAIVQLAKAVAETRGYPAPELVDNFYAAGFDEGALMELIGLVVVRIYTNYVFAMTRIPIDFPAAAAL
ncbi:MAG: alkylhydroperoxidase [Sphingobacteriales bacterium 50-39]|nr:carboxymuconolactone decarboxylase family protein [Sphingobacteriales bacterium]OJW55992.1 MAG: alkylhydroperoxidase [Sphingobacteriales bacterium 50-39]